MVIPEYRIGEYLAGGGLWNPELANHDAVRDLLIDCRDELSRLRARLETVEAETRERCAKVAQDAADEYDALINAGKGEHCKPGYVTDAVWHSWAGKYSALSAIAARLRNLEPRHD